MAFSCLPLSLIVCDYPWFCCFHNLGITNPLELHISAWDQSPWSSITSWIASCTSKDLLTSIGGLGLPFPQDLKYILQTPLPLVSLCVLIAYSDICLPNWVQVSYSQVSCPFLSILPVPNTDWHGAKPWWIMVRSIMDMHICNSCYFWTNKEWHTSKFVQENKW